jgi:hypothetical protein
METKPGDKHEMKILCVDLISQKRGEGRIDGDRFFRIEEGRCCFCGPNGQGSVKGETNWTLRDDSKKDLLLPKRKVKGM